MTDAPPRHLATRVDTWYSAWCPYCKSQNWANNGDETDLTGWDVDALRCWSCKKEFVLHDLDVVKVAGEDGLRVEDGLKNPADKEDE
jgi:hypothetical protein